MHRRLPRLKHQQKYQIHQHHLLLTDATPNHASNINATPTRASNSTTDSCTDASPNCTTNSTICRKVREVFSILSHCHLSTLSEKWKPISSRDCKEKYGTKATYPFSKDPNMGAQMFESDAILEYLFFTYCDGTIPWTLLPLLKNNNNPIVTLTAGLGLLFRAWRGATYRTSNPPSLPLQVALYEGSPFCKLVQKTLCKLELEHTQVSCPRGSPNRQRVFETYS
jgi:hypothetical protein